MARPPPTLKVEEARAPAGNPRDCLCRQERMRCHRGRLSRRPGCPRPRRVTRTLTPPYLQPILTPTRNAHSHPHHHPYPHPHPLRHPHPAPTSTPSPSPIPSPLPHTLTTTLTHTLTLTPPCPDEAEVLQTAEQPMQQSSSHAPGPRPLRVSTSTLHRDLQSTIGELELRALSRATLTHAQEGGGAMEGGALCLTNPSLRNPSAPLAPSLNLQTSAPPLLRPSC